MGKSRRIAKPKPIGGVVVKSRRLARKITSAYHEIQNERKRLLDAVADGVSATTDHCTQTSMLDEMDRAIKLKALDERMKDIGGTDRYQQASIVNTQHFKTSKWVIHSLIQLGRRPLSKCSPKSSTAYAEANSANSASFTVLQQVSRKEKRKGVDHRLKTLEVGAVNVQLQSCTWLDVRAIDLHSQDPRRIEECDFLAPPEQDVQPSIQPAGAYDVVVCSMVSKDNSTRLSIHIIICRLISHFKLL